MRPIETPRVLSWRWAPCVALALGACCFSAFAMLVIPERIGGIPAPSDASAAFDLGATQAVDTAPNRFSSTGSGSGNTTSLSTLPSSPAGASRASSLFPKRGFTPPLERPAAPPPPPPTVQQPMLDVPPPVPVPVTPPQAPPPEPQAAAAPDEPRRAE